MSRPAALEFSFFLSIPTMVVATCYDLFKSLRPHHGEPSAIGSMPSDAHSWIVLAIGFVVSFIVAYGVVAWFMNWVRTRGLHRLRHLPHRIGRGRTLVDERTSSADGGRLVRQPCPLIFRRWTSPFWDNYLALAYLHPDRLKGDHWGARIGRFPASRFFVCGGLDANVCPRWMEQAA